MDGREKRKRRNIHLKLNKQMAPAETRQLLCVNSYGR
jgi:hypothetical protein